MWYQMEPLEKLGSGFWHIFCIDFHNLMGYFNMGNLLTNQRFENSIKSLKRIYRRLAVDDHNE